MKLKETLAEQKKTIDNQNETIQMISTYPALRDLLRASRAPSPPPQDNLLFITGGYNGSQQLQSFNSHSTRQRLSTTEIYPRSSDCSPPSLPVGRTGHTTFVTSEPTALVAACGRYTYGYSEFCLVLDPINQRWDESRMGSLTMPRNAAAAATLDNIGVFIVGGDRPNNGETSEFLAAGTMQWQEGPTLPKFMTFPCLVEITLTSFQQKKDLGV